MIPSQDHDGLPGDGAGLMGVAFKDEAPPLVLVGLTTKTRRDIDWVDGLSNIPRIFWHPDIGAIVTYGCA